MIESGMRHDLPTGTLALLLTDVEGSTKLLSEIGNEGYAQVLANHHRLLRETWARHEGVVVDTEGDAFFVVFEDSAQALAAAKEAQEELASGPVKVRMGVHTGEVLLTETGFVGHELHRAARIASSAHGGQVVLSETTRELVAQHGFSLTELGEHRFKDFPEPIPIYQLGAESFPPLKTISNTNLPRPASSFVGRERELAEVLAKIEGGARLLTLSGPGGSGKTRLALEVAASLVPRYKAGVFWVGLASLRDPTLVTETISQTLGAREGLAEHIAERELLLVLDNLEQVIEASPQLSGLLQRCPQLTLLCTSRELLRIQGEVEYPVPPLAEPDAVSLFVERSGLEASKEIAELCSRLDSLPLAVELAAARTKALTPGQILERLSSRLDLLKGGRDADPRQQTLRATIEWSYDLLSDEEQRLFRALSVFAGGCTLEAAEAVADAEIDTLQSLAEKSLLRFTRERYWMLETIREYADARLTGAGERDQTLKAHARDMATSAQRSIQLRQENYAGWSRLLEDEEANLRAALAFMVDTGDLAALDTFHALGYFWGIRGNWREGHVWGVRVLALGQGDHTAARCHALSTAASFAGNLGDLDEATRYYRESLSIARELGDASTAAARLGDLGLLAANLGDLADAERLLKAAVEEAEAANATEGLVFSLGNLADLALRRGHFDVSGLGQPENTRLVTRAGEGGPDRLGAFEPRAGAPRSRAS